MSKTGLSLLKTFLPQWSKLVGNTKGQLFTLAVSGGADSLGLLLLLDHIAKKDGFFLHVLHVNHGIRQESQQEEKMLKALCQRLNWPMTVKKLQLSGKRSEAYLRQLRYDFLISQTKKRGAQALVLAHHQDDLAETVLMRIIRGSGLWGMQAIWPQRDIKGVTLLRPLLWATKQQIKAYLTAQDQEWCEDASNQAHIYTRNKIRHQLMPLLVKEYNPSMVNVLADLAQIAMVDYECLDAQMRELKKEIVQQRQQTVLVNKQKLLRAPLSLQRLLWRDLLSSFDPAHQIVGFDCLMIVEQMVKQPQGYYKTKYWQIQIEDQLCRLSRV